MPIKNLANEPLKEFIIQSIDEYPNNITSIAAKKFEVDRVTVSRYLNKMVKDKILQANGNTKARSYTLIENVDETFEFPITKDTSDDLLWRKSLLPLLSDTKQNIIEICQYGVTEMINNVIDHSNSHTCKIYFKKNAKRIFITIKDNGVGIFEKIRDAFHLEESRHALLELSKGKLTTDPKHHSGEGIFFSSRMFDTFSIWSKELFYCRKKIQDDDWLIETANKDQSFEGTCIMMEVDLNASHTSKSIFEKYMDDDYRFSKTHVPVRLARYSNEQLVSRSQAKRILARFDKFSEIILDFDGVKQIGQAFADEIFRVYKNSHPDIKLIAIRTSKQIEQMIKHVEHDDG